jgi:hypothetical protein
MAKNTLIESVSTLVEDVEKNAEGFDSQVLIEAVQVTEFSAPVDGDALLEQLRKEGLI